MKKCLFAAFILAGVQVGTSLFPSSFTHFIHPALSSGIGYVDEGPGDIWFEIRNGILVKLDQQGKIVQRMGLPEYVSPNIVKAGSTFYCQWEGFAERQVKQYNYPAPRRWWCTPRGIEAHPRGWNY
jgi:hypothetical protein